MYREFYSRQDVEDAYWILSTSSTLNHGLMAEIWAAKVIAWFHNFLNLIRERVAITRARKIQLTIKEIFSQTVNLIKNGILSVEPITLMQ